MPVYEVKFWRSLYGICEVAAESEDDARGKFEAGDYAHDPDNEDCSEEVRITSVRQIEDD